MRIKRKIIINGIMAIIFIIIIVFVILGILKNVYFEHNKRFNSYPDSISMNYYDGPDPDTIGTNIKSPYDFESVDYYKEICVRNYCIDQLNSTNRTCIEENRDIGNFTTTIYERKENDILKLDCYKTGNVEYFKLPY